MCPGARGPWGPGTLGPGDPGARGPWGPGSWRRGRALRAREAVHLKHSYLEVAAGTERRVVEGRTAISLAEPYVLVHPDCLAVTVDVNKYIKVTFKIRYDDRMRNERC